ncbi:hypothetical protein SM114_01595 [Erwinia pyrifoliae]|uniref:hypothetical protein n=1 Tax=Erwinia pyrifoliae TaxID=79967 RepID=UPI0034D976A7
MKLTLFSGRTGRVVIVLLLVLLMTVAMFAVASLFMAYDPDGHLTRSWLHQSRWGLFGLAHHPLCRPGARLAVEGAAACSAMLAADPPAPAAYRAAGGAVYARHGVRGLDQRDAGRLK